MDSVELWTRAHRSFLDRGEMERAVRSAFWLGLDLMMRGDHARGGGWLARAQRLVEDGGLDCVECGYLLMPAGLQSIDEGDLDGARAHFARVVEIGERFGDLDLVTLGRLGVGQTSLRLGKSDGVPMLDEAMVAVTAGEVSAKVAGIVYCAAILAYQEILDVGRAREWTTALSEWCEAQPDLVPFRGQCLVHRSQVLQLRGAWVEAFEEAHRARERLAAPPPQPAIGMAFYQLGELHRLRGGMAEAERAFREANACGHSPQPGLALLRLAQGRVDVAASAIRSAIEEAADPGMRARALAASVEIMLAAGDVGAAREGAEELHRLAEDLDVPLLRAMSAEATGSVLLAEGDARGAQGELRSALAAWRGLDAPYEIARVGVLVGLAARELGDEDTATMEFEAARARFEELDAAPDLARLDEVVGKPEAAAGLTARELEVLRLVAAGKTNRAIATELVISEKTVARHVSNIFNKVGVSSRAAATAYAYEHDLVST